MSDKIKDILGLSKEAYLKLGKKILKKCHPDDVVEIGQKINKILKSKIKGNIRYRFYNDKKKKYIWIEETVYPQLDKRRKLIGYFGVSRDIDNEKRYEEELNQRWLNYRNLIEALPSGVFIHVNGKIIFGNKTAYSIAEIGKKENLDKFSLLDFLLPEDRALGVERIKTAMSGKDTPFLEYNIITRKGTHKVIRTKSSPILYNSVRAVQIIIIDITSERKLEEERIRIKTSEQINKGLQNEVNLRIRSEEKLKAIFNSSSHLIWTINKDLQITSYNDKYAETVKDQCGIVLKPGTRIASFKKLFSLNEYTRFQQRYKEAFKGTDQQFEIKFKSTDGTERYREIFLHPTRLQGKVIEVAAIAQDVTDRKNAERRVIEQSSRLKAIFESGSQLMWTVNKNTALTSYNKNYYEAIYNMYGVHPEINTDLSKPKKKFASSEYHKFWDGKYQEAFKGKSIEFDTERTTVKGEKIYRHIFLHPIFNDKREVVEVSGIGYDITTQRNVQEEILNKQSQLEAIINTTDDIIFSVDRNFRIVEFNEVLSAIVKERSGQQVKRGELLFSVIPKEYHEALKKTYSRALAGESMISLEKFVVSGTEKVYEAHYNPIKTEGNITGVAVFSRDITEQKENEDEILNKQSRLSAIINNTNDIILSIDNNFRLIEFNDILKYWVKKAFNIDLKEGMSVFDTLHPVYHKQTKEIYKRVFKGESVNAVQKYGKEGGEIFFETNYNPITTAGKITGIAIFSRDITHQKKSEEDILKSLKEKDVLLKEVHHRVKNNLQVISSILNLQTAYLKDKATINILKECQNRIKTMAFIHESLYQNKDFSQINFSEYIVTLVKNLFYSFEANQQKIRANFDVEPILLNLDTSIPCGLIINELVSNALKYAFKDRDEGVVFIELKKIGGKIKMVVADNGRGIPEDINYKNTETLGLQLVNTLTEQINGSISMKQNKGTIFEILF